MYMSSGTFASGPYRPVHVGGEVSPMSFRITRAVFSSILIAGLVAACGGSTPAATSTPGGSASASASAVTNGQLPQPELATVRIGISTPTEPVQFAEKLADSIGIYKKYGITATVTGFEGDGKALQ